MKIDHFQHKNTEIFKIGQEIRELANWLIVQKWPLFEPKMFTVQCGGTSKDSIVSKPLNLRNIDMPD